MGKRCAVTFFMLFFAAALAAVEPMPWTEVEAGLNVARFAAPQKSRVGDSLIHVLRADPRRYRLELLCAAAGEPNLTIKQWSAKHHLLAAINAGMFQLDYKTHVGYMRGGGRVYNAQIKKKYFSVAAFSPGDDRLPPFRIFDLDVTPLEQVLERYQALVQNLRLIKRPGRNSWKADGREWSEAALGEDGVGNVLLIFCRSPYTMHDFNRILLSLPLDLQCAQHLEGGPEASLFIDHGGVHWELNGSYESGFSESDANGDFWPIPNVLGVVKK